MQYDAYIQRNWWKWRITITKTWIHLKHSLFYSVTTPKVTSITEFIVTLRFKALLYSPPHRFINRCLAKSWMTQSSACTFESCFSKGGEKNTFAIFFTLHNSFFIFFLLCQLLREEIEKNQQQTNNYIFA